MSTKALLKTLLKILISGGLLVILFSRINSEDLAATLSSLQWWQLLLGVFGNLGCQFLSSYRWLHVAQAMKLGTSVGQFFRFYLIGMFLSLFLPTAVGGDVGRAMMLSKEKQCRWVQAFSTILAERFCGLFGLLFFVTLSLWVSPPPPWPVWGTLILTVTTGGLMIFIYAFKAIEDHPLGRAFIERFLLKQNPIDPDKVPIWPDTKGATIGIVISIAYHGLSITLQYWLLTRLGVSLPWPLMAVVYGLSGLASMIPLSLSGIGLREGSITLMLTAWGHIPDHTATVFSLVWLTVVLLSMVPGGCLLLQSQLWISARKKV